MTVDEIQTQLETARQTAHKLQKAVLTPSGDVDSDLDVETRLVAAERLVERLERQLAEGLELEDADKREAQIQADLAQLAELENEHRNSQARSAHAANIVAKAAETQMDVLLSEFDKRKEIAQKHEYLYKRVHGNWPDEDMRELHVSPMPSALHLQGEGAARTFGNVAFALKTAIHDRLGGELSLRMVEALINGATRRQLSHEQARAAQTPDMDSMTPAQRFAIQRRGDNNNPR